MVTEMPKKPHVKILMESQYDNGSQTLLNSAQKELYHFFSLLWNIFNWKKSVLVVPEILRLLTY